MQIIFMSHEDPELAKHANDCWLVWCSEDPDAECTRISDYDVPEYAQ